MQTILTVIEPGPLTTVQDQGRTGFLQYGVPLSGVMDRLSADIANLLLGNTTTCAVLECTLWGGTYRAEVETLLAVTGAEMDIHVNDKIQPQWTAFPVQPGDIIRLGLAKAGCRAYLAIAGGIDTPLMMNSRSTFSAGKIGGLDGRALEAGDALPGTSRETGQEKGFALPRSWIPPYTCSSYEREGDEKNEGLILRAIPGPQDDYFCAEAFKLLFAKQANFTVSTQAGRSGYRLEGPCLDLAEGKPRSIISEPSLAGSIQVPENGQPIILLREQTAGGYAKIATVLSVDLDLLAQTKPGDTIRFKRTSVAQAQEIYRAHQEYRSLLTSLFLSQDCPGFAKQTLPTQDLWQRIPEHVQKMAWNYLCSI